MPRNRHDSVAPRAGAWVEIVGTINVLSGIGRVAPRAGAWVEIGIAVHLRTPRLSLLVQGRGLKYPTHSLPRGY